MFMTLFIITTQIIIRIMNKDVGYCSWKYIMLLFKATFTCQTKQLQCPKCKNRLRKMVSNLCWWPRSNSVLRFAGVELALLDVELRLDHHN